MRLVSLRLENVGGFKTTEMPLSGDALLIGENNSGKTSMLRILDWCLNYAHDRLQSLSGALSDTEEQFLIPARDTRNRARRIFLRIAIDDGRSARKFECIDGIAELRIQFRSTANYAKLGPPSRGEMPVSDANALELLQRLQASYCALYVPATRDGHSDLFEASLRSALSKRLVAEMTYEGLTGNPGVRRRAIKKSTENLAEWGQAYAADLWNDVTDLLHGGFQPEVEFQTSLNSINIVKVLAESLQPRFSLGDHDANRVGVDHLGAGLQSVLSIALAQLSLTDRDNRLLLLEEPEAFLHPSSQRTIAQQLLNRDGIQTVATTHSAHVLAEADPSSVVVIRDHTAFPPSKVSPRQQAIDQQFLSNQVAGSMFDRCILLVEGAGDVAFFEQLRRDLRGIIPDKVLNRMRVSAVGSKDSFGPWLRLLRRFVDPNSAEHAFNMIVCADSVDATASVIKALRDSGVVIPTSLSAALSEIAASVKTDATGATIRDLTRYANNLAESLEIPLHFNLVDLEYSMTEALSDRRALEFASENDINAATAAELRGRMGSKRGDGSPKDGAKAPYLRSLLAHHLRWDEVSDGVKDLLWRWASEAAPQGVSLARPAELMPRLPATTSPPSS